LLLPVVPAQAGTQSIFQSTTFVQKWNRAWKIRLIEEKNPEWRDLSSEAF
jgi:putative endonuclease